MKDIIYQYLSLLHYIKRINIYRLKANRKFEKNKVKFKLDKKDDNPHLFTFTNRRAKLTSEISRGKFGSFCILKQKYKWFVFIGCRGPPSFDFLN